MVPMADNFNHSTKICHWTLMHKNFHLYGPNENSKYFETEKFMCDFSALYENCEQSQKIIQNSIGVDKELYELNISGYFNK